MSALAVTGTRFGATEAQLAALAELFNGNFDWVRDFHHGDCVGADAQAAVMARDLGCRLICHPPEQTADRAYVVSDEAREPLTYLARNRAMVDEAKRLVAFPRLMAEEERGGTWYTIRYARKRGYPVTIIWPDGRIEHDSARRETPTQERAPLDTSKSGALAESSRPPQASEGVR